MFWTRRRVFIGVIFIALLLRAWAAWQLPIDADEPLYMQAAYDYAGALRSGNFNVLIDYPLNREHPPLVKVLYGLAILVQGEDVPLEGALFASRAVSAFFGVLSVSLLALLHPLAGLFMAVQTTIVKYTSEAYLEALPLFASLAAVYSLLQSRAARDRWFWLSALALGLAGAGKFSYFPILFVILYLLVWERKYAWPQLLLYLGAAGATFFALDFALWRDPVNRLVDSLFFHAHYSQGTDVQRAAYPWYQPFIWVFRSMPYTWHPEVFFYFGFDGLVASLAVLGLKREWHARRWVVVWIVTGMVALLLWPTRWPQYSLVVLPAFCLAAQSSTIWLIRRIQEEETYWNWLREMFPRPSRAYLVAVFGFAFLVTLGQITNTVRQAWLQRGWWQFGTSNSAIPSNAVHDIQPGFGNEMILATEKGLVVFSLSEETGLPENWMLYTPQNSGLASQRVTVLAKDSSGSLWFGTQAGISQLTEGEWQTFRAADLGLAGEQVLALEVGSDGRLWVGASAGIAAWDGQTWQAYTSANSGLPDDFVTALAIEPQPSGDILWAGTRRGVSRFDPSTGDWTIFDTQSLGLGRGGISDLMVDSEDQLWVASLGGGLFRWDGQDFTSYRVSNSKIPSNTVQRIVEIEPGVFWVATAVPTQVGGVLARFDGQAWQLFTPGNSGFSGAEPLDIARDSLGRLWIATRTAGVEIYQPRE